MSDDYFLKTSSLLKLIHLLQSKHKHFNMWRGS